MDRSEVLPVAGLMDMRKYKTMRQNTANGSFTVKETLAEGHLSDLSSTDEPEPSQTRNGIETSCFLGNIGNRISFPYCRGASPRAQDRRRQVFVSQHFERGLPQNKMRKRLTE